MEKTADATLLPDDVIREILRRVPTDAAALFRCAATCKLWRAIVADLSFLRHHWPEDSRHPSSLLGFIDKRYDKQEPPFFCPVPPAWVLGARRRHPLTSFVSGAQQGDILNNAAPLAARGGLLLVRRLLAGDSLHLASDSLHLAVCDIFTGTCDVLPPLKCSKCNVSRCGWAILTREDCCSPLYEEQGRTPLTTGYSTFFKVLAILSGDSDQDCSLCTFSSSEPNWSEPRKCFDQVLRRDKFGLRILTGMMTRATVSHGVAYWLGSYSTDQWSLPRYFTFGADVYTGQISLTELSIPVSQLAAVSTIGLTLSVAVDGKLLLFHLQKEGLRLNTWAREDDGTWLLARGIKLKLPKQQVWDPVHVTIVSGEKSDALFMVDIYERMHKTDRETGVMENVKTEISLGTTAVPIEIDWPAFFMSRLAV